MRLTQHHIVNATRRKGRRQNLFGVQVNRQLGLDGVVLVLATVVLLLFFLDARWALQTHRLPPPAYQNG